MRREGSTNESQSPFTCPPIRYQFSEVLIFFGSLAAPRAIILHLLRFISSNAHKLQKKTESTVQSSMKSDQQD